MKAARFITENERRLIDVLAGKPMITMYEISKEIKLGAPSVLHLFKGLQARNLIRAVTETPWRTGDGKLRRELALTFVGCVFYLVDLEKSKRSDAQKMTSLASNYGEMLDYPPFLEYDELDSALDNKDATEFCTIASFLLTRPGGPPECSWNKMTFKYVKNQKKFLSLWSKDEMERAKKEQERLWMNEFAVLLLSPSLPVRRAVHSPKLNSFYKGVLEERIHAMQAEIDETMKLLHDVDERLRPRERRDLTQSK